MSSPEEKARGASAAGEMDYDEKRANGSPRFAMSQAMRRPS